MHIAIAGNIGAGKTTLAELLAKKIKWDVMCEPVEENPYLNDFYNDMEKWAFNLQVYFLGYRFRQIKEMREKGTNLIQDRTIYEDAHIFASNLNDMGLLPSRDFENYLTMFNLMNSLIKSPDLVIYLKSSVPNLVKNIHQRGREYENSISIDYLSRLNNKYEEWILNYKESEVLILDVDEFDINDKEDFATIVEKIKTLKNNLPS